MVQGGCRLGFALEATPGGGVGQSVGQELDGGRAIELGIERTVNRAHTARPERRLDAVASDQRATGERPVRELFTAPALRHQATRNRAARRTILVLILEGALKFALDLT